jgi:ribosomal protein S13
MTRKRKATYYTKLTEKDVKNIIEEFKNGEVVLALTKKYKISRERLYGILEKAGLHEQLRKRRQMYALTEEQVLAIMKYSDIKNMSVVDAARALGHNKVSTRTIYSSIERVKLSMPTEKKDVRAEHCKKQKICYADKCYLKNVCPAYHE